MLQLKDICKTYVTGSLRQDALDHISVAFRDREFVAVLGTSGSGKTTLLNIVGGLDRYDSGDLIIRGVSTRKYKDRDWDAYRNHTIGFVFQSYNLIPHQSILSNVELALTISGVSGSQRRKRAEDALGQVGLGDQMHKKPSQLSGGQMQRVAIARALVNNPDILLADEPTGALDSETSEQVMDLLKEVARDHMVIMVTHNPDLAYKYATRIIRVKDGHIIEDTDPYTPEETAEPVHKRLGKASMSYLTALSLSFNNLLTKKARTFLVSFAGSIGIIGIALILSLSTGVNQYIDDTERETLAQYPLEIDRTSMDLTSMMQRMNGGDEADGEEAEAADGLEAAGELTGTETAKASASDSGDKAGDQGQIQERSRLTNMYSGMKVNDLASLKTWIDGGDSGLEEYANAIEYSYEITPQIYRIDPAEEDQKNSQDVNQGRDQKDNKTDNAGADEEDSGAGQETNEKIYQVNPSQLMSSIGMDTSAVPSSVSSSMTSGMSTFHALPRSQHLYEDQYEVLSGHWPESAEELVLILNSDGTVDDMTLYTLGLKSADELDAILNSTKTGEKVALSREEGTFTYGDFLGRTFRVLNQADAYIYDEEMGIYVDRSKDQEFLSGLLKQGRELVVAGVVKPAEDAKIRVLYPGISYSQDLVMDLMNQAVNIPVVTAQLADPSVDVLTGRAFGEDSEDAQLDLGKMFTIDEEAMQKAFNVDFSQMAAGSDPLSGIDMSQIDLSGIDFAGLLNVGGSISSVTGVMKNDLENLLSDVKVDLPQEKLEELYVGLQQGFQEYKLVHMNAMRAMYEEQGMEAAEAERQAQASADTLTFADYLQTEGPRAMIGQTVRSGIDSSQMESKLQAMQTDVQSAFTRSISAQLGSAMEQVMAQVMTQVQDQISRQMTGVSMDPASMFQMDPDALSGMVRMNMSQDQLQDMLTQFMTARQATYEGNLKDMGYADPGTPDSIMIYPVDFESKEKIADILTAYNDRMEAEGKEDSVVHYTDIVGTLMSSVTDIVNAISYVLIAFVAISLVVSSIMIGVITYISVLERRKEIGILRAIGASKHNIAQVFNAETFITGFLAGLIGIVISLLLLIPINQVIAAITDGSDIRAFLPPQAGAALILLSVILTLIGGIIPSKKAAASDPVEALRSE